MKLNPFQRFKQQGFYETLRHTATYFGGTIIVYALSIISIPIYTSLLSTEEFAVVEIFNNLLKALMVVVTLNAHSSLARYYYEGTNDFKSFFGTTLLLAGSLLLLNSLLFLVFREEIIYWLNLPPEVFYWLLPAVTAMVLFALFNQLFVAQRRSGLVSKLQIVMSYSRFGLAVLGLLFLPLTAYFAKIVGDVVALSIVAIICFFYMLPFIQLNFQRKHLQYILNFSVPMMPLVLSGMILNYFDQLMINSSVGRGEAGIYSFAYKVGALHLALHQALINATNPKFFEWMREELYDKVRQQEQNIIRISLLGAAFLILFSYEMVHLLTFKESFRVGLPIIPFVVLSYVLFTLYTLYSRLFMFSKKTGLASLVVVTAGAVNIGLNAWLIPLYGYQVAAYTTLASYVFMFGFGVLVCRWQPYPTPIFKTFLAPILAFLLTASVFWWLPYLNLSILLSFFIKLSAFSLLGFWLFRDKLQLLFK